MLLHMIIRCVHFKTTKQIFKFKLFTEQICLLSVEIRNRIQFCLREIIFHRYICNNRCKFLAHYSLFPVFHNIFGCAGRLYHIRMGMNFLNTSVVFNECCSRLLSDSRHSRNIICRIPHQSLYIDELLRCDLISILNIQSIVILYLRTGLLGLRNPDSDMICRKLEQIAISRYHRYLHSFPLAHSGKCSQQIIRLISFHFYDTDSHCCKHLLNQWHLLPQRIIHRCPGPLVRLIHFMTKSRCMYIKCNSQIIRLLLL